MWILRTLNKQLTTMKKASILIIALIIMSIPLQTSCAQTSPCPANNEKAKKVLIEYLAKERNIQGLQDDYNMTISNNAKNNIKPLSGERNRKECQQLTSNLEWLGNAKNYSIYKVADHYFIVIYSFNKNEKFQWNEIPIVNSEYKAIGSIINFKN